MKKLLAVMLAVALMFSFAACKSDEEKAAEAAADAVENAVDNALDALN